MKLIKQIIFSLIPAVLVLVLTVLLSQIFFRNMIDTETEKCKQELTLSREDSISHGANAIKNNMTILDLVAEAIVLNADFEDRVSVAEYLLSVQNETIFDRIDIFFPNGTLWISSTDEAIQSDKNYDELLKKGTHVSQRELDYQDSSRQVIHVFSPVYDNKASTEESIAILCATIYRSTLENTFAYTYYEEGASVFVVDRRDGNFIVDKRQEELGNFDSVLMPTLTGDYKDVDIVDEIRSGNEGVVSYVYEGNNGYMAYAPVDGFDFSLGIYIREDVVFSSVNELRDTIEIVSVIETLFLLFVSTGIYFIILRSMQNKNRAKEAELQLLHQKEIELQKQYDKSKERSEFLERMAKNLPGGYHRCTTDHAFRVTFASDSFIQITGYDINQLNEAFDGSYMGIVYEEDRERFMSLAPQLERDGSIKCFYRIRRRDGKIRWVKDSTQYIAKDDEKYYQCALMDITEYIEEINEAKAKAEASSQAKSTFLFNISHDIRTPMNAIKGFAKIIEDNKNNPKIVGETIVKIKQASNTLMALINDVLDLSRIEKGKEEVYLQPMKMDEHCDGVVEMFTSEMEEAGIEFSVERKFSHGHVKCDSMKLARIEMNMLSNAKKFTPKGGKVLFGIEELYCDGNTATYRFYVKDTGIGMSEEFLSRAFKQFEREHTSTESRVAGSGLGLAIIQKFVDIMGGSVELKSQLGKGTEISATLTFALVSEEEIISQTQTIKTSSMKGKRVLLVEDNEFNREIARYILESVGFEVEEATNGAICLEMLTQKDDEYYDLVLMDIQMPLMDGYVATQRIRNLENKKLAEIPIVAMTANAFDEDKKRCLEIGMNGHVGKPIELEALIEELFKIIH